MAAPPNPEASRQGNGAPYAAPAAVLAGLIVAAAAWLLPVNLKSVSPALLRAAGGGTPTVAAFGEQLVDGEKIGPASLVLEAARAVGDPGAPALAAELERLTSLQPALTAWGGWDPFLDPLFHLRTPSGHTGSTPVVTLFLPEAARAALGRSLQDTGSLGARELLELRQIDRTGRFVPATKPGGQPLDTLLLLTAALYQGDYLSSPLQREVRTLTETALDRRELGDLEPFFLDLLSLGWRLDWGQLTELLRRTQSVRTVDEYAHLARVAPAELPLVYAAALFTDSADGVSGYLIRYGKAGAEDLRLSLADGQGAVRLLVLRGVPVNRQAGPTLSEAGALVLAHPQLMLAIKYLGYLAGIFLVLRGLDRWVVAPGGADRVSGALPSVRSGLLATLLAGLLVVVTEPFLLHAAPASEFSLGLRLPVLIASSATPPSPPSTSHPTMDTSTLVSIGVFAVLQVIMYLICLRKIGEIDAQDVPPLLKLRLMENEENLFDSGLYVGMMGTAAALVLQVLGVIQPNLLAAYSSNLFGIVCVALVKIRHVRGFRRRLIIESLPPAGSPGPVPTAS
jgi:hypothetical protein